MTAWKIKYIILIIAFGLAIPIIDKLL